MYIWHKKWAACVMAAHYIEWDRRPIPIFSFIGEYIQAIYYRIL